jgi:hypothetical protein
MSSMRIGEGHFGEVRLDGLQWVITVSWPGAVHEGNGSMQVIIDERADEKQREGLEKILLGEESEPGATVFQVFSTTMTTVHETLFRPIEFSADIDQCTARVSVLGLIESEGEPIRNPVTGNVHRARVTLPHGFEYLEAEYGSGTTKATGEIKLDTAQSYGQFAMIHMTPNGPVR